MSPSTHTPLERIADYTPTRNATLLAAPRALAFWAAIVLPLAYMPLLTRGLTPEEVPMFVGLLLANVAALLVGHGHNSGRVDRA